MDVDYIIATYFFFHLTDSFHKRHGFDIPDSTTDFCDNHISPLLFTQAVDILFNFVCDVRDNLNSRAQVVTLPFLVNDIPVNATSGNIRPLGQIDIDKAFVVT